MARWILGFWIADCGFRISDCGFRIVKLCDHPRGCCATPNSGTGTADESLASIASQINQLVEMMMIGNNFPIGMKNGVGTAAELTGNFLTAIKQAAKPGLKLD